MSNNQFMDEKLKEIESSITELEKMRGVMPDKALETAKNSLFDQKSLLLKQMPTSAISTDKQSTAPGDRGIIIHGDATGNIMITGNNNLFSGATYIGKPEKDPV
ncbi:hypothetical protein MHK_009107, partial [Candidatus Magnetomorum sp. HK-1]